ncbi:MAG: carboxypeptidase regulatory-like domain-containing protein [Candidatus Solibacter usitatus]|nr:carboxypeptidase regulatory-like domain-containing protein [Candidatus Solibacter usitatus]
MILGRVLDPQSSAVTNASVAVTNVETNTTVRLTSNDTGYYEANLLLPGNYQVAVEAPGFKRTVRSGIVLTVGARTEINVRLELGAVAETVAVTAEAPLLDTSSVSSGRVLDNRSLMDLPVLGNSAILLVKLTPGIQTGGVNNYLGLHSNIGGSDYNTSGAVGGNEWSIDGVPNGGPNRRAAYLPYSDTIQEFKVETSTFDASIGHTTGVNVAMMTKSGTNGVHGTLTEQHWQQRWNGAPFFVKQQYYRSIAAAEARGDKTAADAIRNTDKQASGRSNNYAATIGGPVVLPRIYNGKDKLFFFFSWNGFKDVKSEDANSINRTIPTLANRQGDFSQLLSVDAVRYQIYDPLTVRPDPDRATHYIRTPFAGNVIPRSRFINPMYDAYVKLLPKPNNDPTNPRQEPRNNYLATATPYNWDYTAYSNRIDYNHSSRHRFFQRWSWNDFLEDRGDWTYESARGLHSNGLNRHNLGGTVDWVLTKSATTVFDFAVAANEFREGDRITTPLQFTPSSVGLPQYLDVKAGGQHILPFIDFSDGSYQDIGRGGVPTYTRYRTLSGKADVSHVRGKHSIHSGVDVRQYFRTGGGGGNTSGNFQFRNSYTRRNDDGFTPAGLYGHEWASFILGMSNSLTVSNNDSSALHNPYYAGFVQDNWRITPKLTLNLGLRIEYELGPTERYNRVMASFDPAARLPIAEAAQAAYARNPIPELAPAAFAIQGGSQYAGVGGVSRRLLRNELMGLPRFGASYQVNSRTVIQGGYGTFYDTLNVLNRSDVLDSWPDQFGYSRTTSTLVTTDFGLHWLAGDPANGVSILRDSFPVRADGTRYDVPTRDALGRMARVGRGWTYSDFDTRHGRQQRWRLGVQRQIGANMVLETAYAGSYADRVGLTRRLDYLPEKYWADGLRRNDALASNLDANVPNPFNISNFAALRAADPILYQDMTTQGFFTSATIRRSQLLRVLPQMNDIRNRSDNSGEVRTHALEVRFERRFARGFNFNVGYTRFWDREADYFHNEFDPLPAWRASNDGRPHRLIATGIYELPFGKGKALARQGLGAALFGGWQIALTYEYQPGPLIDWGNRFFYGNLEDINSGPRTLDRWFNPADFERNSARQPASFHRRIFPTRIDGLRRDITNQWNGNLQREIKFKERIALQLRLDALNLQNRSQFNAPNTDPFSTNFGKVESQTAATNRFIQIQGRIRF